MKFIQLATFIMLVLGLITTNNFFVAPRYAVFILLPYFIMLAIAAYKNYKNPSAASHLALFIAASAICTLQFSEYYKATYHPGSSTAGLIFLVMPVFSIVFFIGVYSIANALIRLKPDKYKESIITKKVLTIGLVIGVVWAGYIIYRSARLNRFSARSNYYQQRDFTNGDFAKAKTLGVFVKDLHFTVDSFKGILNFYPYIEKGFKYSEDSTEIKLLQDTNYPYTLSYQRKAVKNAVVVISKKSEPQLGYGAPFFLNTAVLDDTIYFDIKRSGVVVGTIKVWD